mgnify:CR=1 FL=1
MNFNIGDNSGKVKSLQRKLIISIVSIVILSIGCLSIILIEITSEALRASVIDGFIHSNRGIEKTITYMTLYEQRKLEKFKSNKLILDFLKNDVDKEKINNLLINDNENNENSFETYIVNNEGIVIASNLPDSIGADISSREYFIEARNRKKVYTSNVLVAITTGKTMSVIAQPIIDEDGEFLGIIGRDINTSYYKEVLKDFVNQSSIISIIDNNRSILYHDNDTMIGKQNNIEAINEILLDENKESGIIEYEANGKEMISTYGTIRELGWKIFCIGEKDVLFKAVYNMKLTTLCVLIIIIIIALITAINFAKYTIKPIMILVNKLGLIAKGDFTVRVNNLKTGCEIDLLLNNFNNMMNSLQVLILTIETAFDGVKEESDKLANLSKIIKEDNLIRHRFIEELNKNNLSMSNILGDIKIDIERVILMNSELLDINISNDEIFRHMELLRDNVSSMILEVLNINRYIDNEFINLRKYIEINNFVNDDLIKFYNKIENLITMEESQIGSINKVFTKINELSSSIENSHMINEKKFIAFANCINNNLKDNLVKVKNEEERIIKISEELQKISNSKETITNRYIKIIKKLNNLSDTAQSLVKIFKVNK